MMNRCPGRMETTGRKEVLLRFKQLRGPNPSDATSATVRIVRGGLGSPSEHPAECAPGDQARNSSATCYRWNPPAPPESF